MKKAIIIALLASLAIDGWSQQFQKQFEIVLPDTIQSARPGWVDLDNDGLLDVLIISAAQSGKSYFQFIKGDTVSVPGLNVKKKPVITINSFVFTDYDRDNRIDVVVSGLKGGLPVTAVYLNQGAFDFQEKIINASPFTTIKIADLDDDAVPEWIVSGEESGNFFLRILKQETDINWKVAHDTLLINAGALEVFDADNDGDQDIFISGKIGPSSLVSGFLMNQGKLYFKQNLTSQRAGATTSGDFNSDGIFDVLLMSKNQGGTNQTTLYESATGTYNAKNLPITLDVPTPFAADFNSDGVVDVNYLGKTTTGDTLNLIQYGNENYDTLVSRKLVTQRFGDREHDGDLDLLQVIQEDALHLVVYKNQPTVKNLAPGIPKKGVAVSIYDRVFVYWDKPTDDHTPTTSLTFDLHLEGSALYQAAHFDLLNQRRLTVSHGNNGTQNFRLLRKVQVSGLNFAVQAIDNSLHAGALCIGNGTVCVNVQTEKLQACSDEQLTLAAPSDALWFSFSKGFLGVMSELSIQTSEKDTVFYYEPAKTGCSALKAWTITINNDTVKTEMSEKYSCKDSEIQFTVEPGWTNIEWSSALKGDLGSTNTITYKVTQPDSVFVTMTNTAGCKLIRKTAVKISEPVLQVSDDNYKILKGEEVQLNVTGASTYEWTPATGLSQANIPNPVASPAATTLYTVTGYDSVGCSAKATVNIVVEGAGFIPNLFTPNDDGKNDELKLYGMPLVKDFVFSIYNREGSLVYRTSDVSEATSRGWDGTKSGTKQPPGVYFWKVKGEVSSGDRILLNGKDSGSIVLVR